MKILSNYLDALFAGYPENPKLANAKADLHQMMVDKYDSLLKDGTPEHVAVARVISELGDFEDLITGLNIDDLSIRDYNLENITASDVESYLSYRKVNQSRFAFGILLLISPLSIPLFYLSLFGWGRSLGFIFVSIISLALVFTGIKIIVPIKAGPYSFHLKLRDGIPPTSDALEIASSAIENTKEKRGKFYFLSFIIMILSISIYLWSINDIISTTPGELFSLHPINSQKFTASTGAIVLSLSISTLTATWMNAEQDVQRILLSTAYQQYSPNERVPYPTIRVISALIIPTLIIFFLFITGGLQLTIMAFFPIIFFFIYWVANRIRKALENK